MPKYFPAIYMTDGVVGSGEANNAADVKLIQTLVTQIKRAAPNTWAGLANMTVDGRFSPLLEQHIRAFQQTGYGSNRLVVDGKIHPMRITSGDLRATFRSGVGSTLYWLNVASFTNVPRDHDRIAGALSIPALGA